MKYLDGKKLQKNFLNDIQQTVQLLGIKPVLAVLTISLDPEESHFYKEIKKMCEYVGYQVLHYSYAYLSQDKVMTLIQELNKRKEVTSILIETPIPDYLDQTKLNSSLNPTKDIDGIHPQNKLKRISQDGGFLPCVVLGLILLLKSYSMDMNSQNVVIINRSERIGKPLLEYFLEKNCTVTICHSQTKNLEDYLKNADIVVSGVGKPKFLDSSMMKENSVVIDLGISIQNGKSIGDIEWKEESNIKYAVPSVGGTGPMTIAAMAQNILKSAYLSNQKETETGR